MCGIIGYIGKNNAADIIIDGLRRLEYRGYDSAGIAFPESGKEIEIIRCRGKINDLVTKIGSREIKSQIGIGHTRWATHGTPSEENAHPHVSGNFALVHNGIIENYIDLKRELINKGYNFLSDTDTEVICHLIESYYMDDVPFEEAVRSSIKMLKGSYAIAVINDKDPEKIVCARKDSPLVLGIGEDEFYVASDVPAFLNYTRDVIFMDDGELAVLSREGVILSTPEGVPTYRPPSKITWSPSMAEKGGYKHFMLKEIYEQPRSLADTVGGRINQDTWSVNILEFGLNQNSLKNIKKIFIAACGTSWHAALCGKYMIEGLARIPVEVDIASEFRYRNPLIEENDLFLSISQSGETADTLAAMREAKKAKARTLTICNVLGSSASRESDYVFYTHSGPEIGVASTKAFMTQLVSLYMLAIALSEVDEAGTVQSELINDLLHLPSLIEEILLKDQEILAISKSLFKKSDFLYLGRGILYPIALEGALKLKEISYIHAEGYPAGEMKHGPIALIDEEMPVLVLLSEDSLYEKVLANIEEVKSRDGITIVISNKKDSHIEKLSDYFFYVPPSNKYLNPLIMAVPLQLLAYHIAVFRGCDVDQPRNLAKSVTVE